MKDIFNEPLAIVGMSCRFPGVDLDVEDVAAFHEMLIKGQTPIKEVPPNRWNSEEYYDADRKKADKIISRLGGFLNDIHLFDTDFFKISPAEAKHMDPQHRLFLEVAIRALNHANITFDSLNGSNTGVYCGISSHDYSHLNYKDNIKFNEYTQIGVANSAAGGRLSHFLNLKGPNIAVDTACSSSLSALYLAAMALRTQQCSLAIVGGVHLNLCPENFIGLTKANLLSASGQCSSFDIEADGFVRSEGCGVVIVKRLHDAIKDNNTIHAVIKSIVMNQDGEGPGLTVPNREAQIAMHQAVLEQAHLVAGDIDYIETHGTGTVMGDSVEFNAIQSVHQGHHSKDQPLILGALKSNLGHTISSSGIASLIKVLCALKNETIPANLHYSTPNTLIDPESIPALFPVKPTAFIKQKNKKRHAQISNFGFSGTNVSVIIEEPPHVESHLSLEDSSETQCFVISANSEYALKQMLENYLHYLNESSASLSDICATLINCRDHFKYRCAIIARDKQELIKKIESKDYEMNKVVVKKDTQKRVNNAHQIYEYYRLGATLQLDKSKTQYNQVDLPLYYFDRKPYWHERRTAKHSPNWLDALYHLSKEQQIETIKTKIASQIHLILGKDDELGESIDEYEDVESLGLTRTLLGDLDRILQEMFSQRYKMNLSFLLSVPNLTIDKLAKHIHQIIIPVAVHRQPLINVLNPEPIAIIGMSCRLPKASHIDEFLSLLERGESGMVDIPIERWDNEKYYDSNVDTLGKLYIKQLGLIDDIKKFDAEFFNISPREAKFMSPQLRIFMEASYHALEDANLSLEAIKDSNTGVFVGCGTNEYPGVLASQNLSLDERTIYYATGNVLNALPGRVAYAFDFHGPIQAIDTACSSSMTAIHNACLSLQSGDCDMALAGGVNILLSPDSNITLSKAKMLSPESRCKTFSEDADGYARSEGCGVLVLKRLTTAIEENNHILAVIKGSSINSDGKSGGFTVPNGRAQEEVIRSALAKSKLSPSDIDYIEVHGTGTPVADPIEANVLTKIFSEHHSQDKPLYISSVKTNIGHCESAAGVASVIKAVLSLQTQKLFKHLNFKKLNPDIQLKNTSIPLSTVDWVKAQGRLRCAGVSSFGFSGANAHVVLQQAPSKKKEARTLPKNSLLVLSAKSKVALELLLLSYQKYLFNTQNEFADICYTAATCRSHFLFRVAIQASTAKQAAALIKQKAYLIHHIKTEKKGDQQVLTLEQLRVAYQDGFLIDWSNFYKHSGNHYEKVKLPLYEFDRKEHWVAHKDKLKEVPLPKDWCFQLQWQHQSLDKHNLKIRANHWLLIGGQSLAAGFIAQGLNIVLEEEEYSLSKLDGIIFAEALDSGSSSDIDSHLDFQKKTIKKLLSLVKELTDRAIKLQFIVLTTRSIAELAVGSFDKSHSSLIGLCRTLVLELPDYHTVLIDLDKPEEEICFAQVLGEMNYNHDSCYEHIVAYRDGERLVARLKRVMLVDNKRALTGEGRYLITGGCGGLGLVTAQALLSAGARELILTSRTIEKPALKETIKKIQSHYPDCIIRTLSLDVTHQENLRHLLLDINGDGLLKGIIHAAGAVVNAPLIAHQEEDVDYLFSAKVKGGWYLHELSQHCELDFFVVYSSISSVFGSNKESVYSATNSFLDALIAERHRLGLVGTAIQWGPWGEVGMAKGRAHTLDLTQAFIDNEQGYSLIKVLINSQHRHVAVISPDYLRFMLHFVPNPKPVFHQDLAADLTLVEQSNKKELSSWLSDYFEMSHDRRPQACTSLLYEICKEILEQPTEADLDEHEGFFELGFDSLMLAEMAAALNKKLEPVLQVSVTIGFDYPSIHKLAQYIESELAPHLIKKRTLEQLPKPVDDAIAIIGMSCSLPNAPDLAAFETLLEEGLSGIKDIPIERWDNKKYYDPNRDAPRKSYVNKLGLIENIKYFDAHFFGISPREAQLMEPQQRIFLECCYNALEHANYPVDSLRGSLTGVYAGVGPNEYYAQLEKSGFSNEELSAYSITGNVSNLISGRVAYTFDFKGPSISIDTACSSSLVAIHYACQGLKSREIDYALAGGVNVLLMPESNITLCKANALSPDGQCKTFDEQADGYARAEGCGVIFLKRMSDAVRDQDTILAVIKASAINNDGKAAGLTVPNGKSQEEVMRAALGQTGLSSHDISYIEVHGTGTPLGDPIEVHAINNVYGSHRDQDNPLYLGAVKTNIGHLESASGVAGLIKTVLSLRQMKIYKNLNFNQLNPNIKIKDTRIALHTMDWDTTEKLRCAAVNAFGFSGTNAHVILQEFPNVTQPRLTQSAKKYVLVLSAKSKIALDHLVHRYQHYLEKTAHDFGDLCFTAATCREHYTYRLAVLAETAAEASRLLETGQFALSHEKNKTLDINVDTELRVLLIDYLQGNPVDWSLYYKTCDDAFIKVALPHYTFLRSEFWLNKKSDATVHQDEVHPLLGLMLSMPGDEYLFSQKLDLENLSYIKQHCVFEKVIFPATAYIESALAAAKLILNRNSFSIEKFNIKRPLHPKQGQEIQLQVKPKNDERYKVNIFVKQEDNWHAFSEMELDSKPSLTPDFVDIDTLKSCFDHQVDLSQIYEYFKQRSFLYGDEFQVLQEGYVKSNSVLAKVALTKMSHGLSAYHHHPVLLDGAMQSIFLINTNHVEDTTYVPYAFTRMTTFQRASRSIWVHVTKRETEHEKELCVDIKLYDHSGLLISDIEALKLRAVTRSHFVSYESVLQHLYYTQWSTLSLNLTAEPEIPELLVISSDPIKAKKLLGNLRYQLVQNVRHLVSIENKNIVFLYEQTQFNDLVHCCQNMIKSRPNSFILVTENAYAIQEHDQVNPNQTMASSFWKSFRNEFELNKNYTVDLDSKSSLIVGLKLIFHAHNTENQLAIRDSIYRPRLKRKRLVINDTQQAPLFNREASYLITGGTGGLAKLLIEYLMRRGVKQIIMLSRSECSMSTKILIENARQKHVCIQHYEADASNAQQMKKIFERIDLNSKPLKGVFHLAGVVHDGLIAHLTDEDIRKVFIAKRDSALILHQLTQNIQLDLFVLFSSSASLLGAQGQSNYAAANGFLDGLAHVRQQQGLPAIAINWGPFQTTGMTANMTPHVFQRQGFIPLAQESIEILDVLLKSKLTQISPCPIHWDIYFKHSPKLMWLSEQGTHLFPADQPFLNSLRHRTHEERVTILSHVLCEIAADVLALDEVEQITAQDNLFTMGMDSLMSIEIRNRIQDQLQCPALSLSIEYFIHNPIIETIAQAIANELQKIFERALDRQLSAQTIEEIALCDFQYVFWVLNKLDYSFNIGTQLQLQGKLNKEYVFQAFDFVVKQNSAFWIHVNEQAPTQVLKKQGQFKLIYFDWSSDPSSQALQDKGLNNEFYKNIMRLIPLTTQPLIKVYLYQVNPDLHELHLVIPHIIVDDTSCELVLSQFKHCYEALIHGTRLIPAPEKDSYFNYVKHNNHHYEKNLKDKIDFWRVYNKGFKKLSLGQINHLPDAAKQTQHLFHYPIAAQCVEQFINWHKEKNMNVSTGLVALCHLAFYKISHQKKIPIILIHSGREGSQYKSIVGLFSEYKRINMTLNEGYRLIDWIKSIEAQLLKTAPYQKCSHLIKERGLKGSRLSLSQYLAYRVNKLVLTQHFKKSMLHSTIIDYYQKYLSKIACIKKNNSIKHRFNTLFKLNRPLQKPKRLRVLLSITPSFFSKELQNRRFADLDYTFPSHLGCVNRPIGNQTLWVYFSKNQQGEYLLSINGPLTTECKDEIAKHFNHMMAKFVEHHEYNLADLMK